MRLIGLRYKTNSYRILVGLSVRFDSYSYSYSLLDDRGRGRGRGGRIRDLRREGGRRFTDLGLYGPRREKSWEYPWPSVHRPWPSLTGGETVAVGAQTLADTDRRRLRSGLGRWCTDP